MCIAAILAIRVKRNAFFFKRFIRLYPTLWIIAPAWIVASILFHKAIGLPQIMTTILLTPSMLEPVPDVVWTLRHEVLFYASFLVLILNRRLGILLYGVWTSLVVVQLALAAGGHAIEGLPSFFLSTYELDFLMGAGIALLAPAIRPAVWPLAVGLVLVTGALVLGDRNDLYRTALVDYVSISATWWVLALGVCFAALLYGMLAVESLVRVPRWLVFLGGSSYALYLVHVPIQIVLASAAGRAPAWLVLTAMVVVPVAAGAVLHVAIERPLSRWLRKALLPPPAENARAG